MLADGDELADAALAQEIGQSTAKLGMAGHAAGRDEEHALGIALGELLLDALGKTVSSPVDPGWIGVYEATGLARTHQVSIRLASWRCTLGSPEQV